MAIHCYSQFSAGPCGRFLSYAFVHSDFCPQNKYCCAPSVSVSAFLRLFPIRPSDLLLFTIGETLCPTHSYANIKVGRLSSSFGSFRIRNRGKSGRRELAKRSNLTSRATSNDRAFTIRHILARAGALQASSGVSNEVSNKRGQREAEARAS